MSTIAANTSVLPEIPADESHSSCRICGENRWKTIFEGKVRAGSFGSLTPERHRIEECEGCAIQRLESMSIDYESGKYRHIVEGSDEVENFYRLHDGHQAHKLQLIGTDSLRGGKFLDVGCAAGSLLDLLKGFCSQTIAVEPCLSYHGTLREKGHLVFSFLEEAAEEWREQLDFVTAFDVIEHVEDPVAFLRDIGKMLRPGGQMLIGTPNRDEWLLEISGEEYRQFWFRAVHRWYFNGRSLEYGLLKAGIFDSEIFFNQLYDLSNALVWLRDGTPSGFGAVDVAPFLDAAYRKCLEVEGRSDYVYARATKT